MKGKTKKLSKAKRKQLKRKLIREQENSTAVQENSTENNNIDQKTVLNQVINQINTLEKRDVEVKIYTCKLIFIFFLF